MNTPLSLDLYLHPEKRSHSNIHSCKAFDLYGLATILIEIALWEPLVNILARQTGKDWVKRIIDAEAKDKDLALPSLIQHSTKSAFVQEIAHAAGPRFLEAIEICLNAGNDTSDEADSSVTSQQKIVDVLQSCSV